MSGLFVSQQSAHGGYGTPFVVAAPFSVDGFAALPLLIPVPLLFAFPPLLVLLGAEDVPELVAAVPLEDRREALPVL